MPVSYTHLEQLHGEHALVFYWFQHERDRLAAVLKDSGLRVRVYQSAADEQAWNAGEAVSYTHLGYRG